MQLPRVKFAFPEFLLYSRSSNSKKDFSSDFQSAPFNMFDEKWIKVFFGGKSSF
jgi:hypothetical protein